MSTKTDLYPSERFSRINSWSMKDVLERKIEDLTRKLSEERHNARKEKQQVAKLQRDIARQKGDRTRKDTLMKDLERERLIRAELEHKLRSMTEDNTNCRSRLHCLQQEFKRMEETVRNMMQYKSKIDQLKQEKSSLSVTYENNMHKYRNHISTLERENIMLLNDVKRFESQPISGKTDDRTKLLLGRLKILESENSALVMENEQQRQQYEKCLDEIANQVVQALLAQKTLREECLKLQGRVQDLEYQNHELNSLFQEKLKYDPAIQDSVLPSVSMTTVSEAATQEQMTTTAMSLTQTMHLSPMSQYVLQTKVAQKCLGQYMPGESTDSLRSICSNYTCDDSLGKPQMSLPVWATDQSAPTKKHPGVHSSTSTSVPPCGEQNNELNCRMKIETEFPANNSSPKMKHVNIMERANQKRQRSSSTSSLHSNSRSAKTRSTSSLNKSKLAVSSGSKSSLSGSQRELCLQNEAMSGKRSVSHPDHIDKGVVGNPQASQKSVRNQQPGGISGKFSHFQHRERSSSASSIPIKRGSNSGCGKKTITPVPSNSKLPFKSQEPSDNLLKSKKFSDNVKSSSCGKVQGHRIRKEMDQKAMTSSSGAEVKDRMAVLRQTFGSPPRVPLLPNGQYFYDYSDEDSDFNRPVSADFSNTSTISLNEILDHSDDTDTLLEEDFTTENFAFFESPSFVKKHHRQYDRQKSRADSKIIEIQEKEIAGARLHGKPDIIQDTENSELQNQGKCPRSPYIPKKRNSLQHSKRKQSNQRPSSLILAPREKQFMHQRYSSSSSSLESSDSDENWSPRFARKYHQMKQGRAKPRTQVKQSSSESTPSPPITSSRHVPTGEITLDNMKTVHTEYISPERPPVVMTSSSETVPHLTNSLTKRKGPPPPIPSKPSTGRRSPGIRMGTQSPGFRHNKKETTVLQDLKDILPKSQEIKPDSYQSQHVEYTTSATEPQIEVQMNQKIMVSAELSFDKAEKVERSGSKDDGYSTMSSDIQPEAMEKFNDTSIQNKDTAVKKESPVKVEEALPAPAVKVNKTDLTSDLDSAMDSSTHSTEMRNSTHSLSSQNSNSSEDRAAVCGSLGRVKAMKILFEAENQKQNDNKLMKFPLRKSPSMDSKLGGGNKDMQERRILNRRSLGDDFKMFVPEIHHNHWTVDTNKVHSEETTVESTRTTTDMNIPGLEVEEEHKDERSSLPSLPVFHHVQTLNISEENFLSDIPEEKDEWEASTNSCDKLLEDSLRNLQSSTKYYAHLQLLQTFSVKRYWCSTEGLARVLSDSDLSSLPKIRDTSLFDDLIVDTKVTKPLERSASLSDMHTKQAEIVSKMKVIPKLRKRLLKNEGQEKDVMKRQILQQLAHEVESESDGDNAVQFHSLLIQNHVRSSQQVTQSKVNDNESRIHLPTNSSSDRVSLEPLILPSGEEIIDDQGTQFGSKETSPAPDIEQQGKFRSDYYSLCNVGSNRSLLSSGNEGDLDIPTISEPIPHTCQNGDTKNCEQCCIHGNNQEFDEISRQLESLSKTVNALHQSLTSLNSCDTDKDSNEDHSELFTSQAEDYKDTEGYQWVEDEFYLTPCGGELIMGNSPFSETGACCDWVNEYADDTSCNDEFEFYGNFVSDDVGVFNKDKTVCPPITEEKEIPAPPSGLKGVNSPKVRRPAKLLERTQSENLGVLDPQTRAAMLDSMVELSGGSMDSLDDNIGVDHVMCSRLIGRGDKIEALRSPTKVNRPALDLSKFFLRFGDKEMEAMAAFDFLNDMTPSPKPHQPQPTGELKDLSQENQPPTEPATSPERPQKPLMTIPQSVQSTKSSADPKDAQSMTKPKPGTKQTQGSSGRVTPALKQAQRFAAGSPTAIAMHSHKNEAKSAHKLDNGADISSVKQGTALGSCGAQKHTMGLIVHKPVSSSQQQHQEATTKVPVVTDAKTSHQKADGSKSHGPDKCQSGTNASASPKPSRMGFFRRKNTSAEKKTNIDEKSTKAPKKLSQNSKEKEKDKSKIPKAVKQDQTKPVRRFLRSSGKSSSVTNVSSASSHK
ncbi:serine-rich adhesin for platelets-like isoform X3 [Argopecten irradians]|uniref:serine-rich adhesin for platelets-like isoform X3 n=1 Tax=Argopecten irradians TaxID=31199 RepID=UPI00371EBE19